MTLKFNIEKGTKVIGTAGLTKEYLNELFEYRDGELYWKRKTSNRDNIGQKAGTLNQRGYIKTGINKKIYSNHRLIFMMFNGFLPKLLDHIDGNKLNNRIENLREATNGENKQNSKLNKNSSSGVKGVHWNSREKKWQVRVQVGKKRMSFGYFKDLELADLVAQEARNKYHQEFARHK
jgi:hypothetical protein